MSLEQEKHKQLIGALGRGMPLRNAADYIEVELKELKALMKSDPGFRRAVNKAIADCLNDRLEKLAELKNWQALAFILQSLWPKRFGRRSRGIGYFLPPPSEPLDADLTRLSPQETDELNRLLAKLHGRQPLAIITAGLKRAEEVQRRELEDHSGQPPRVHSISLARPGTQAFR